MIGVFLFLSFGEKGERLGGQYDDLEKMTRKKSC